MTIGVKLRYGNWKKSFSGITPAFSSGANASANGYWLGPIVPIAFWPKKLYSMNASMLPKS